MDTYKFWGFFTEDNNVLEYYTYGKIYSSYFHSSKANIYILVIDFFGKQQKVQNF